MGEELQLTLFGSAPEIPPAPRRASSEALAVKRDLFERLQGLLAGRLRSLVLTDNRRTILSTRPAKDRRRDPEGLEVRLHRAFGKASAEVLEAVATVARGGDAPRLERARKVLRDHMEGYWRDRGGPPAVRPLVLQPVGETLDLRELRDDLNRRFFGGRLTVGITWSNVFPGVVCRSRSIRLGSFQTEGDDPGVVRIHPALDQPRVPRFVVESVVYHELLHADIPPVIRGGRRHVHTPEFRRRERLFPEYRRAKEWIRKNLKRLLRY